MFDRVLNRPMLSGDGLMFFRFLLGVVPLSCYCGLKPKSNGSVLLSSLMGNYQTFYLFISHLAFVWVAVKLEQRVYWEWCF